MIRVRTACCYGRGGRRLAETPADEQIGFVLHLGDFIYEIVWYPEDRPQGYYDRKIHDVVRYGDGEKINDFHVPTTIGDYRAAYRVTATPRCA